jgi:hypothetical protein
MPLQLDRKRVPKLALLVNDFQEQARAERAFGILGERAQAHAHSWDCGERRPRADDLLIQSDGDSDRRTLRVTPKDFATSINRGRLALLDRNLDDGGELVFARNPDALQMTAHRQRPLKSGLRFSRKAVRPSFASSDANAR